MTILVIGKRALTFIELLLVIAIIGILVAGSLPSVKKTFNNLQLNSFSGELQSFMNYLHERSIVERKVIFLSFDPDSGEYWAQVKGENKRLKSYHIPEAIKIESDEKTIAFYPDGSIDTTLIKLINRNNEHISLTTKGVFGGVKASQ